MRAIKSGCVSLYVYVCLYIYVWYRCVIFFYLPMVLPKLICEECYLNGLKLSTYKLSILKVLRNITEANSNAFQVQMIQKYILYQS